MHRPYLRLIIVTKVTKNSSGIPILEYDIDTNILNDIAYTYLGKNILIKSRSEWDDEKIIKAYRSQFIIVDVFKNMKDRNTRNWWPMYHLLDSNIKVHGLYCSIAALLCSIMCRKVEHAGIQLSAKRLISYFISPLC